MRSILKNLALLLLFCAGATLPVYAVDAADEDTISVVEEGGTPERVINVIQLPAKNDAVAPAPNSHANDRANDAREQGRAFGQQISKDARANNPSEQARDKATQAKEKAKTEAKARGRPDSPGNSGH